MSVDLFTLTLTLYLFLAVPFLAHSNQLMHQWRSVRRPSLRLSVSKLFCANRFFYQTNGWIATKLAHDGLQVSLHPGFAQCQGPGKRSRDTSTFGISQKKSLTRSFPNFSFPLSIRFSSASQSPNGCDLRCEFRHSSHGETVCQTVCSTCTIWRSVSTCAHFMKHHYTLLPD